MIKGKLLALLTVFVAIGLITASGAFTTVQADRTANVTVEGDSSALLTLEKGAENGDYVDATGDTIEFDISAGADDSQGINLNAVTEINETIQVTNNGANSVALNISKQGANSELVDFYAEGQNITVSNSGTNSISIGPGATKQINVTIDTTGASLDKDNVLLTDITFQATDDS